MAPGGVAEICCFSSVSGTGATGTNVFNWRLNVCSIISDERSEAGSQFRVVGPLTAKLCWSIVVLVRGNSSIHDDADHRC